MNKDISGVINIYKEKGYTSHDVVSILRGTLKGAKVGHTGTLDPNAEGVLPICLGKATKISQFIMDFDKVYQAEVILGITTDTEDDTGKILTKNIVNVSKNEIEEVVSSFIGDYNQIPPMYSALKINGRKLYDLARKGEVVEREPRSVNIKNINIDEFISNEKFLITVKCSKGTYIRTLCKDIGEKLSVGATMGSLLRVSSGNFSFENSIKIDYFKERVLKQSYRDLIIPIDIVLNKYQKISIDENVNKLLYNGNKINVKHIKEKVNININTKFLVYDYTDRLISLSEIKTKDEKTTINPLVMFI